MTMACIHVFMCEFIHYNLCRTSNPVRTRSIIVTQREMLQSLHQSVPQQLDSIQFWGAGGQELEKYSVIVPKVGIKPSCLLEMGLTHCPTQGNLPAIKSHSTNSECQNHKIQPHCSNRHVQ